MIVFTAHGQPKISGKISGGFQAPTSTDEQGRRHLLTGSSAESRGGNVYEIIEPRVTSFNADDSAEMFIEAPRCLYEMKENSASSDSSLSVRTADGRFAIRGVGWHWEPSAANLSISNEVVALVQKSALATNLTANAGTNIPVRITASEFRQQGEKASFLGNVLVQDGKDTLRCDRLDLVFVKPGGLQVIDALNNVELIQESARITSGRAVYDLKLNEIRISQQPRWYAEQRAGSADLLVLNRHEKTLVAEGAVYMRLPLTNLTASAGGAVTNRALEVFSKKFRFEEATSNRLARALYQDEVKVIHPEATIFADEINVRFNATNRIEGISAQGSVRVQSQESQAFGDHAEYDLLAEKIALSGNPHWRLEENTGRSDLLVFFPKTKEIHALQHVEMILPGQSVGSLFAVNVRTNQQTGTNMPMTIRSETFSRGTNVAVFHGNVEISDARGRMSCQMVTIVSAGTNQVQRVIAEDGVRIEQPGLIATGSRAEYDVATGLVHLTGEPQLMSDDKSLRAEAFVIDRNKNTFSVSPGKYRIEMQMKPKQQARALTARP